MPTLSNVKILLGISETDTTKDALLNLYLKRVQNLVLTYCNDELNDSMSDIIEDITVIKYRKNGVENLKSEAKGALQEVYLDDLPSEIINRLNNLRRLKFL